MHIIVLFLIIRHNNRTYTIQGLPRNVPGAPYRWQSSGWMQSSMLNKGLREHLAI